MGWKVDCTWQLVVASLASALQSSKACSHGHADSRREEPRSLFRGLCPSDALPWNTVGPSHLKGSSANRWDVHRAASLPRTAPRKDPIPHSDALPPVTLQCCRAEGAVKTCPIHHINLTPPGQASLHGFWQLITEKHFEGSRIRKIFWKLDESQGTDFYTTRGDNNFLLAKMSQLSGFYYD